MSFNELLKAVLTPLVAFALRWFFALIGVPLDETVFWAIVGALVSYFLSLFGVEAARAAGVRGIR